MVRVVGITGGICSGKSTLTKLFAEHGIRTIDADILGHRTYEQGTLCYQKLREAFGEQIISPSGDIDRRILGGLVFADSEKMKKLRAIVWPEIGHLLQKEILALAEAGEKVVAIEAAVMVEAGWHDFMDEVWVVYVSRGLALERLMARNGVTEEQAIQRLDSQMAPEERLLYATVVVENSGSLDSFRATVQDLLTLRPLTEPPSANLQS